MNECEYCGEHFTAWHERTPSDDMQGRMETCEYCGLLLCQDCISYADHECDGEPGGPEDERPVQDIL